jgi:hypothetical protein
LFSLTDFHSRAMCFVLFFNFFLSLETEDLPNLAGPTNTLFEISLPAPHHVCALFFSQKQPENSPVLWWLGLIYDFHFLTMRIFLTYHCFYLMYYEWISGVFFINKICILCYLKNYFLIENANEVIDSHVFVRKNREGFHVPFI